MKFIHRNPIYHYIDVITTTIASQITSLTIVYSTVYSDADQGKHQSSASLAFVRGIHRWPVNSPHKGPVTRKMFPFDDVIMNKASRLYIVIKAYLYRTEWIFIRIFISKKERSEFMCWFITRKWEFNCDEDMFNPSCARLSARTS